MYQMPRNIGRRPVLGKIALQEGRKNEKGGNRLKNELIQPSKDARHSLMKATPGSSKKKTK